MKGYTSALVAAFVGLVAAAPMPARVLEDRDATVSVVMAPSSTVVGTSALGVETFNGIPFASPPTGSLRLRPPVRLNSSLGTFDATGIAAACPQFLVSTGGNDFVTEVLGDIADLPFFQTVTDQSEDCLTVNIFRPAGVEAGADLPVLFWIFGGGFEVSSCVKTGDPIVASGL